MKLIKVGNSKYDVVHNATCMNCKSEYEFKLSDPELFQTSAYENKFYFACHVCNQLVFFSQEENK